MIATERYVVLAWLGSRVALRWPRKVVCAGVNYHGT